MRVIGISSTTTTATQQALEEALRPEVAVAWDHYKRGILREIYLRQDKPGAVILLECPDLEAARAAIAELPLVQRNLIEFQLIPLGPFTSFELLFAAGQKG